jgi:hypothetical protein
MDFIAFKTHILGPTSLESAVPIDGFDSVMWIERYREPGEFKFTAPLASDLRSKLPLGTLVSHTNTMELMFVESHTINEESDTGPQLEISGRSFDAFLENRVVSLIRDWTSNPDGVPNIELAFDYSWEHAKTLINNMLADDEDLPDMLAITDMSGAGPWTDPVARVISRGYLSERVRELLGIDDLGLRMVRKNPYYTTPGDPNNTLFIIHNGKDRRDSVIFSPKKGDIESSEQLWTNKTLKNVALVSGRWLETRVVLGSPTGYDRRAMFVDASDIDQGYETAPTGIDKDAILAAMVARGQMLLAAQRQFMLTRADTSAKIKYQYRRDYGIGDIVTVQSNYGDVMYMRIIEFTEIQDENGQSSHPTLGVLDY